MHMSEIAIPHGGKRYPVSFRCVVSLRQCQMHVAIETPERVLTVRERHRARERFCQRQPAAQPVVFARHLNDRESHFPTSIAAHLPL